MNKKWERRCCIYAHEYKLNENGFRSFNMFKLSREMFKRFNGNLNRMRQQLFLFFGEFLFSISFASMKIDKFDNWQTALMTMAEIRNENNKKNKKCYPTDEYSWNNLFQVSVSLFLYLIFRAFPIPLLQGLPFHFKLAYKVYTIAYMRI